MIAVAAGFLIFGYYYDVLLLLFITPSYLSSFISLLEILGSEQVSSTCY